MPFVLFVVEPFPIRRAAGPFPGEARGEVSRGAGLFSIVSWRCPIPHFAKASQLHGFPGPLGGSLFSCPSRIPFPTLGDSPLDFPPTP